MSHLNFRQLIWVVILGNFCSSRTFPSIISGDKLVLENKFLIEETAKSLQSLKPKNVILE